MSDYFYFILPSVTIEPEDRHDLVTHVRSRCRGRVLHNHLSHFRVNVMRDASGSIIEPVALGPKREPQFAAVLEWARSRCDRVSIRLEGHRGILMPLPPLEKRVGTLSEALAFRPHDRKPHHVEFALVSEDNDDDDFDRHPVD